VTAILLQTMGRPFFKLTIADFSVFMFLSCLLSNNFKSLLYCGPIPADTTSATGSLPVGFGSFFTPPFLYQAAQLQELIPPLFYPFDIGHMRAVLRSLGLLYFQHVAFLDFFHKYLWKYHLQPILFAFLNKQVPKI